MKTSTQLKALIRNLSKSSNVEAEIILRNFMMERFLERIAASNYRKSFILKGGMLIAAIVGIDTRTTMDIDATIKGQILSASEITAIIKDIIRIPLNDGVELTLLGIDEIREEADYPGFRVSIETRLDKTRQTLKVDITTGDFVTPKEIEYSFRLMFEDRTISIMAYNLETILSEKFETIITRGLTNTRMRDFYDIYILTTTQTFDTDTFNASLKKTVEKRGTTGQIADISDTVKIVANSPIMIDAWHRYQKKFTYADAVSWKMAIDALKALSEKTEKEDNTKD